MKSLAKYSVAGLLCWTLVACGNDDYSSKKRAIDTAVPTVTPSSSPTVSVTPSPSTPTTLPTHTPTAAVMPTASPTPSPEPSSTPEALVLSGVFSDSVVEGLRYETASQSGVTDARGVFFYLEGEDISFFIHDISIGTTKARASITPLNMFPDANVHTHPSVINLVRLLLTLDTDGDPEIGISLPNNEDIPSDVIVDFLQSVEAFDADEQVLLLLASATNVSSLVEVTPALLHFKKTLLAQGLEVNSAPETTLVERLNVEEGSDVILSATVKDIDSTQVTTEWSQVAGPTVSIQEANKLEATFVAPDVDETTVLRFHLSAIDETGAQSQQEIDVIVEPKVNLLPKVVVGEDLTFSERDIINVTGTIADVDGTIEQIEWHQSAGEPIDFAKDTDGSLSLIAPLVSQTSSYTFTLTATDNDGGSASDSLVITVVPLSNQAPRVNITSGARAYYPGIFQLMADVSDSDGDHVDIAWRLISGPIGVSLNQIDSAFAYISIPELDEPTTLVMQVLVTDENGATASDQLTIYLSPGSILIR